MERSKSTVAALSASDSTALANLGQLAFAHAILAALLVLCLNSAIG